MNKKQIRLVSTFVLLAAAVGACSADSGGTNQGAGLNMPATAGVPGVGAPGAQAGGGAGAGLAGTGTAGANAAGSGGMGGAGAIASAGAAAGGVSAGGTTAAGGTPGAAGAGGTTVVPTGPQVSRRGSEFCDETNLWLGEMRAFINEWTDPEQDTCVFLTTEGQFGWTWSRGSTGLEPNPTYPNYPEVEFGINPWNSEGTDESTTDLLPMQLKDFMSASLTVDVTTVTTTNNGWNLAFEVWLSDTDPTLGPANPKAEIMVFLGNHPGYYPDPPVAHAGQTLMDGGHTFTLHESQSPWGEWDHYRQWRIGDTDGTAEFNGTLDIHKFLAYHRDTEGWDPNLWVTRFEIGNETFQNSGGTTTFNSLSWEINGETRDALTE